MLDKLTANYLKYVLFFYADTPLKCLALNLKRRGFSRWLFPPISYLFLSVCVFEQADPWGCRPASLAALVYRTRGTGGRPTAARVRPRTGGTAATAAVTAAVTSAARCAWTFAVACAPGTAATPSVPSAWAWHRAPSPSSPQSKLRHQRHNVSPKDDFPAVVGKSPLIHLSYNYT